MPIGSAPKSTLPELLNDFVNNRLKDVHTSMPGIIQKFNNTYQTASVQPAIKRIFKVGEAEKEVLTPIDLPLLINVPILYQQCREFCLTMPIEVGDECLVFFSERAIDLWHGSGEVSRPSTWRMHSLSDGFCIVGPVSKPGALGNYSNTDAEFKSKSGSSRVTLQAANDGGSVFIESKMKDVQINAENNVQIEAEQNINLVAKNNVNIEATTINLTATNQINMTATTLMNITAPLIVITGNIQQTGSNIVTGGIAIGPVGVAVPTAGDIRCTNVIADSDVQSATVTSGHISGSLSVSRGSVSLHTHTHGGVEPGSGTTSGPT